jgi:hypothetical protein
VPRITSAAIIMLPALDAVAEDAAGVRKITAGAK